MRFALIEQRAGAYPVRLMCRVLEVSPSGCYGWRGRGTSARAAANARLLEDVRRIQARHHGRYGSPRMHAALRAEGRPCSRAAASSASCAKAASAHALAGRRFRPCTTTDSRHHLPVALNLLAQRSEAPALNRAWPADIGHIPTGEGWRYLAAILDLATRKIIGWVMRDPMRTELTRAALMMAVQRQRPAPGLIHHSCVDGPRSCKGNVRFGAGSLALMCPASRCGAHGRGP